MACGSVIRAVLVTEPLPWRHFHRNRALKAVLSSSRAAFGFSKRNLISGFCGIDRAREVHAGRPAYVSCLDNNGGAQTPEEEQGPPQEAVLKAISEVSKAEGRVGQTTNMVIGGTVTDDANNEWLALDQKVNSYPTVRGFTAIGTGGDDFVQAMVVAVESVIQQPIPEGHVRQKISSRGKYVSVNIGPVQVVSSEQVQAVYNAMRRDDRMKYFL